ncbi:MAG: ribosomal subunit interface protein [Candidatus Margulisbacteria bacterium GWF2_35_9]|nr:MAG: ribosomal subunit interface protein [Candidatus Margulisbacteria bacterium GWF2_35_9]
MEIIVSGQNLSMTEALREYAEKKIGKIDKFFTEAIESGKVEMVYHHNKSPEKSNEAKVMVSVHGAVLAAKEEHEDMYAAIDLLFAKLEKQLLKYKDKMKNRKREKVSVIMDEMKRVDIDMAYDESDLKDEPVVYSTKQSFKPMSVEEAVMRIQVSNMGFLFFYNIETNQMNVLYKRKDKDLGLIEPEQ